MVIMSARLVLILLSKVSGLLNSEITVQRRNSISEHR